MVIGSDGMIMFRIIREVDKIWHVYFMPLLQVWTSTMLWKGDRAEHDQNTHCNLGSIAISKVGRKCMVATLKVDGASPPPKRSHGFKCRLYSLV